MPDSGPAERRRAMGVTHRIRRLCWQVSTASTADAFAVRSLLRRENNLSLLAAMENAFTAIDDKGRDIHLSRLDIAIRISSLANLAQELPAQLAEATRQALREKMSAPASRQLATLADPAPTNRLQRYLNSGQLDWFDTTREPAELRLQLTDEAAQWSHAPAATWSRLLAEIPAGGPERRAVFFRFLQLLTPAARASWWDFALHLAGASGGALAVQLATLRQWHQGRPDDPALRLQSLGLLLLSLPPRRSQRQHAEWVDAVESCAALLGPLTTVERDAWRTMEKLLVGAPAPAVEARARNDTHRVETGPVRPTVIPDRARQLSPDHQPGPDPGLPLGSVGLILLHPYLPRLFAALGWIAADHPPGMPFPWASLPGAAALLHWLASGRDEPLEFELGTAKLLLGLPPDAALPVAGGLLDTAAKGEGEALLAAVLQHWPALGKTSIDGLRVAFLQRNGLLYPATDGWLLRPQAESFDLLLDRLPWGISTVRLPWMPYVLHSEWPST